MPARDLPNLGLKAGYDPGENGWGDDMTENLLKLSTLTQATVIDKVAATPGSPAAGDVYLFSAAHPTNANNIAIFDGPTGEEAWTYVTPGEGWLVFNKAANYYEKFDGTVWAELAIGGGGGGISDAPADGKLYGRQDAAWEEIISGGNGGFVTYATETTLSTVFSDSAAATKGNIFVADRTFHLFAVVGRFGSTGTYKAVIAHVDANDAILSVLGESGSVVIVSADGGIYRRVVFPSPVEVPIGTRFALAWVRTDGTGTTVNSVPFPAGLALPNPAYSQVAGVSVWAATNAPTVGTDLTNPNTGDYVCGMLPIIGVHYGELEAGAENNVVYPFRGARVARTADQAVGSGSQTVAWTTETYDLGDWHDNAVNNSRLVVPAGVKRVEVMAQLDLTGPSKHSLRIHKNGTGIAVMQVGQSGYTYTVPQVSTGVIDVVPGDYFEVQIETGGGTTVRSGRSFFAIHTVSDKVSRSDLSPTLNAQAASYSLVAADDGNIVEMTSASANTVTIPANATTGIEIGSTFSVVQIGAGVTTIQAAAGVTLNGISEGSADISGQWGGVSLYKRGANEWVIQGAHGGVS